MGAGGWGGGRKTRGEGTSGITMRAEKPISTPRPRQARIDELAVYVVNVVIEKLAMVLEI